MKLCANNHTQVAFDNDEQCPVCLAVQEAKEDDQRVSSAFKDDIKALEEEIRALNRHLPKRHVRKYQGDGMRPGDEGLYELMVDCRVVNGIHNTVYRDEFMPVGSWFNFLNSVGTWIAVTPVFQTKSALFKRVSDPIAHTKIDSHNNALLKVRHV